MLTERVNKRHCEIEGEEKPSTCVQWVEKQTRKKTKKEKISKALQHTETGSEKEEVLTGCPCGGSCLSGGLRMEVCACVNHMDVYICFLCAYKCVFVMLTGVAEERPVAPEVADIQWSVVMTRRLFDEERLCKRQSMRGHRTGRQRSFLLTNAGLF